MFCQDIRGYFSGNQSLMVGNDNFTIQHYAGSVRYSAENFLSTHPLLSSPLLFLSLALLTATCLALLFLQPRTKICCSMTWC
jgi:hypothetical protein